MASLSNWGYVGRPSARQCSTRASAPVFAVTRAVGHEAIRGLEVLGPFPRITTWKSAGPARSGGPPPP